MKVPGRFARDLHQAHLQRRSTAGKMQRLTTHFSSLRPAVKIGAQKNSPHKRSF
jgi:hypothetical protein